MRADTLHGPGKYSIHIYIRSAGSDMLHTRNYGKRCPLRHSPFPTGSTQSHSLTCQQPFTLRIGGSSQPSAHKHEACVGVMYSMYSAHILRVSGRLFQQQSPCSSIRMRSQPVDGPVPFMASLHTPPPAPNHSTAITLMSQTNVLQVNTGFTGYP